MWIADDVSIPKMTSEIFLAPTPPAESKKCVSRERELGSENGLQIWIADDVSKNDVGKISCPNPLLREPKMCISTTPARIGKRITDLDSR